MKKEHQEAIYLRFEGVPYKDIAEKTGIAETTLRKYFCVGGLLYKQYKKYSNDMYEQVQEEAVDNLRGALKTASEVMSKTLNHYLKLYSRLEERLKSTDDEKEQDKIMVQMAGVLQKASDQAERVLDRGGLPIVHKAEITNKELPSYDQVLNRLEAQGIDPESGHRRRTSEVLKSAGLSN